MVLMWTTRIQDYRDYKVLMWTTHIQDLKDFFVYWTKKSVLRYYYKEKVYVTHNERENECFTSE